MRFSNQNFHLSIGLDCCCRLRYFWSARCRTDGKSKVFPSIFIFPKQKLQFHVCYRLMRSEICAILFLCRFDCCWAYIAQNWNNMFPEKKRCHTYFVSLHSHTISCNFCTNSLPVGENCFYFAIDGGCLLWNQMKRCLYLNIYVDERKTYVGGAGEEVQALVDRKWQFATFVMRFEFFF